MSGTIYTEVFGSRRPSLERRQERARLIAEEQSLEQHEVVELPENFFYSQTHRDDLARARNSVLFRGKIVRDPLVKQGTKFDSYHTCHESPAAPFQLSVSEFLGKARALRPFRPEPTASSFAQWVYSLYGTGFGDDSDREAGKEAEKAIWEQRRAHFVKEATYFEQSLLNEINPGWKLVHNGLHVADSSTGWFTVPELKVRGEALRVSPDLLFSNDPLGQILIVEIKNTRMAVPPNLWPNVWAQLWCYAQLNIAKSAETVRVVGEIWGNMWQTGSRHPEIFLRASVRRDPRKIAYDSFFRELFNIYSGTSVPDSEVPQA